jgi:Resolvase, N terminal domain
LSTDRQGKSGLGLEAQREAVLNYLNGGSWTLVADFTEVESGKHSDRPQLAAALAACKKHKARLVIAKLDRLSRNLAFIAALMDSGVEFIAVDPTPPLQLASTPRGGRAKARHLHGLDKFTRRAVLFPVSKEEGFERQLASCGVATQPQCCAERSAQAPDRQSGSRWRCYNQPSLHYGFEWGQSAATARRDQGEACRVWRLLRGGLQSRRY